MTTASILSSLYNNAQSALFNRDIYTADGKRIGYSTSGHDGDLCNAIAHIDAQYYGIPPEQWYIKTLFEFQPITKYCLNHGLRPKWATVVAGTGQISVPSTVPGAPPMTYVTNSDGQYVSTAKQDEKLQAQKAITTPLLVIGGGVAILGLALLTSR